MTPILRALFVGLMISVPILIEGSRGERKKERKVNRIITLDGGNDKKVEL